VHARVDVVATGPHLIEAERLERDRLRPAPGDRVHADLRVAAAFELPHLMTARGLDDARCARL
jgi:hypothetical protein